MKPDSRITVTRQGTATTLTVFVHKTAVFPRIILCFFLFISLMIPVAIIGFTLADGTGLKLGSVMGVLFSLLIAVFFLRLLLWNFYGKEVFTIAGNMIDYYCDYRYFRDGRQQLEGPAEFFILPESGPQPSRHLVLDDAEQLGGEGKFAFVNDSGELVSQITVPVADIVDMARLLFPEEENVLPDDPYLGQN